MSARRVGACSECGARIEQDRACRPRKTCTAQCAMARDRRRAREARDADAAEAKAWWLSLTEEQRLAAMAHVRRNPPPPNFAGGKQLWAYFSRAAFSCERVPVSTEAA